MVDQIKNYGKQTCK